MGLKYVGEGRYIAGVPARDLSDDEVKHWPEAAGSPLYVAGGGPTQGSEETEAAPRRNLRRRREQAGDRRSAPGVKE